MVVGKGEPKQAAAREPRRLTRREGLVGKRSPAASADSRFWREPMMLKRPMGKMMAMHLRPRGERMRAKASATAGLGRWRETEAGMSGGVKSGWPRAFAIHAM